MILVRGRGESMNYTITREDSDHLQHHGVKGMKWGVRKDKQPSGSTKMRKSKKRNHYYDPDFNAKYHNVKGRKIRTVDMFTSDSKLKKKIQDWSENEDAKIRDDLSYGKISKKKAQRRWNDLAEETDRRIKEIENRKLITYAKENQRSINRARELVNQQQIQQMTAQQLMHQQITQNQHTQQMMLNQQFANQNASLSISGGMNPFMFG